MKIYVKGLVLLSIIPCMRASTNTNTAIVTVKEIINFPAKLYHCRITSGKCPQNTKDQERFQKCYLEECPSDSGKIPHCIEADNTNDVYYICASEEEMACFPGSHGQFDVSGNLIIISKLPCPDGTYSGAKRNCMLQRQCSRMANIDTNKFTVLTPQNANGTEALVECNTENGACLIHEGYVEPFYYPNNRQLWDVCEKPNPRLRKACVKSTKQSREINTSSTVPSTTAAVTIATSTTEIATLQSRQPQTSTVRSNISVLKGLPNDSFLKHSWPWILTIGVMFLLIVVLWFGQRKWKQWKKSQLKKKQKRKLTKDLENTKDRSNAEDPEEPKVVYNEKKGKVNGIAKPASSHPPTDSGIDFTMLDEISGQTSSSEDDIEEDCAQSGYNRNVDQEQTLLKNIHQSQNDVDRDAESWHDHQDESSLLLGPTSGTLEQMPERNRHPQASTRKPVQGSTRPAHFILPDCGNFDDANTISKILTMMSSVCIVICPNGISTGIRVGDDKLMITDHALQDLLESEYEDLANRRDISTFKNLKRKTVYVLFNHNTSDENELKFYFNGEVYFTDPETDIAVVALSPNGNNFPRPFKYFSVPLEGKRFIFIGHPNGEPLRTEIIKGIVPPTETKVEILKLRQICRKMFKMEYDNPPRADSAQRFLFKSDMLNGASGSPGLVLADGEFVVVVTIFLHKYPDLLYDGNVDQNIKDRIPDDWHISQGANMQSVRDKIKYRDQELYDEIFEPWSPRQTES